MNPPPPIPQLNGSVTPSVAAVATAASTALPPVFRTRIPAAVASALIDATAPPVPVTTGCAVAVTVLATGCVVAVAAAVPTGTGCDVAVIVQRRAVQASGNRIFALISGLCLKRL